MPAKDRYTIQQLIGSSSKRDSPTHTMKITIVGAGIAGLASALALTKWLSELPDITIIEIRRQPSTIGGAVGLTPNAQRCLHHLGVLQHIQAKRLGVEVDKIELLSTYNGAKLGHIDFKGAGSEDDGVGDPPFKGLRIMRADLLQSLIECTQEHRNIKLEYNCKAVEIVEQADKVMLSLENDHKIVADVVLGCDGIHSSVRKSLVDPEREPIYTGIAAVHGFAQLEEGQRPPWHDTGLCQSQRGCLMSTYYERTRRKQFVAAIMQTEDVVSREGWIAKGMEQEKIRQNVKSRHSPSAIECLEPLIEGTENWALYPVYKLAPKGKWCSKRTMLLGDAAHAMPPQGESTAYALEDAILFARILQHKLDKGLDQVFLTYQDARRERINKAYDESVFGWETQKDSGWFMFVVTNWLTSTFLWWTRKGREERYREDMATVKLE